jgi:hypothetical protein
MANGLLGSTILEVVIGLIFVYLLLAIICTTVNEWIAGILKTRSSNLKTAIDQLLDGQAGQGNTDVNWFLNQFRTHPLIAGMKLQGLKGKADSDPSYISARAFAITVMDIATPQAPGPISFADLEKGITGLPDGDVKTTLLALIQNANHDIGQAQKNIENWFNDTMQRVSGWYKRTTQIWTLIIAAALTICANADTLQIVKTLWTDPTLRAQIVEQAKARADKGQGTPTATAATSNPGKSSPDPDQPASNANQAASQGELDSLGRVFGWSQTTLPTNCLGWADRLLGWILSIIAISLGAPFWFDLLNKFMRVRNSGDAPDETTTTAKASASVQATQTTG